MESCYDMKWDYLYTHLSQQSQCLYWSTIEFQWSSISNDLSLALPLCSTLSFPSVAPLLSPGFSYGSLSSWISSQHDGESPQIPESCSSGRIWIPSDAETLLLRLKGFVLGSHFLALGCWRITPFLRIGSCLWDLWKWQSRGGLFRALLCGWSRSEIQGEWNYRLTPCSWCLKDRGPSESPSCWDGLPQLKNFR